MLVSLRPELGFGFVFVRRRLAVGVRQPRDSEDHRVQRGGGALERVDEQRGEPVCHVREGRDDGGERVQKGAASIGGLLGRPGEAWWCYMHRWDHVSVLVPYKYLCDHRLSDVVRHVTRLRHGVCVHVLGARKGVVRRGHDDRTTAKSGQLATDISSFIQSSSPLLSSSYL